VHENVPHTGLRFVRRAFLKPHATEDANHQELIVIATGHLSLPTTLEGVAGVDGTELNLLRIRRHAIVNLNDLIVILRECYSHVISIVNSLTVEVGLQDKLAPLKAKGSVAREGKDLGVTHATVETYTGGDRREGVVTAFFEIFRRFWREIYVISLTSLTIRLLGSTGVDFSITE